MRGPTVKVQSGFGVPTNPAALPPEFARHERARQAHNERLESMMGADNRQQTQASNLSAHGTVKATSPNGTVPARQGEPPFRGAAPPASVWDRGQHPPVPRHGR